MFHFTNIRFKNTNTRSIYIKQNDATDGNHHKRWKGKLSWHSLKPLPVLEKTARIHC